MQPCEFLQGNASKRDHREVVVKEQEVTVERRGWGLGRQGTKDKRTESDKDERK